MIMPKRKYMLNEEESELVEMLSSEDPQKIREGILKISGNKKLCDIEKVHDYCIFVPNHINSEYGREICRNSIDYLKEIVENHGLTENGHFDDHAKNFITLLNSEKYNHLLKDPIIAESFRIVNEHYNEDQHSAEYEMRLNHLHEVFSDVEDTEKQSIA